MNYQETLDYLRSSQNEIELLQESSLPSVGIFYYVNDTIEVQSLNLPLGRIINKTVDEFKSMLNHLGFYVLESDKISIGYNALHIDMFKDIIKRLYPKCKTYTDIPRGRVFYNYTDKQFVCLMDKCLDNVGIRKRIEKEFNTKLKFDFDDDNYTCLNCKEK